MKTRIVVLVLLAAFVVPGTMNAQVGNFLKKKLEQAVAKEVDEKVEEAVAGDDTTEVEAQPAFNMSNLGIGKVTAKYEENYSFKGLITMKTEIFEKGKSSGVIDISAWYNVDTESVGMESSKMESEEGESMKGVAIVDAINQVMITWADMESGKSGMIMTYNLEDLQSNENESADEAVVRKTGNTRTILGYKCDEYEVLEEKGRVKTIMWTTKEVILKGSKLLGNQQGMPRYYGKIEGSVMASETYEKGIIVTKTEVTGIDKNATHSISTKGVSLMQMDMSKMMKKKN